MTRPRTQPKTHPTLSDVALALASRHSDHSDPVSKVSLSLNAKGDVQIDVDVSDSDPKQAAKQAADLFDVLRAKYPRTEAAPAASDGDKVARRAAAIARAK